MAREKAVIKVRLRIFMGTSYLLPGVSQPAVTFSKLTIETLEQVVKYVQS